MLRGDRHTTPSVYDLRNLGRRKTRLWRVLRVLCRIPPRTRI